MSQEQVIAKYLLTISISWILLNEGCTEQLHLIHLDSIPENVQQNPIDVLDTPQPLLLDLMPT